MEDQISGLILNIARFCTNDGSGIRSTVFLKGCPLHCAWCHNPEGISPNPQLVFEKEKCVACGACGAACPNNCHSLADGMHMIDFAKCNSCGKCVSACGFHSLSIAGKWVTADQVIETVVRDIPYYRSSSGGVTLSGGEILYQAKFTISLLKTLKNRDIHTCVETSGAGLMRDADEIFRLSDLVLLDFKHSNPEGLRQLTGLEMKQWMRCIELIQSLNKPVILRCPVIPGINLDTIHMQAIADVAKRYSCIQQIELLAYHNLGCEKAKKMNLPYQEFDCPDKDELQSCYQFLTGQVNVKVLLVC